MWRSNIFEIVIHFLQVLKLKPPSEKEIFDKLIAAVKFSIYTDGYNWSFWKTGGGWGEVLRRYKPYTPKDKKEEKGGKGATGGDEKVVKGKGKAPVKGEAKPKGRGMYIMLTYLTYRLVHEKLIANAYVDSHS